MPRSRHVAHHLFHLVDERAGEPRAGPLGPDPAEDQHRQLGQPVAGQHVDRAALDHLPRAPLSRSPKKPGAVGDADRVGHVRLAVHSLGASSTTSRSPVSTRSPTANRTSRHHRVGGRGDRVLHLHRLDHHQHRPVDDRVAGPTWTAITVPGSGRDRPAAGEVGLVIGEARRAEPRDRAGHAIARRRRRRGRRRRRRDGCRRLRRPHARRCARAGARRAHVGSRRRAHRPDLATATARPARAHDRRRSRTRRSSERRR